jgi:hypothetical protein
MARGTAEAVPIPEGVRVIPSDIRYTVKRNEEGFIEKHSAIMRRGGLGSRVKLRTLQVCTDEPARAIVWKRDTLR